MNACLALVRFILTSLLLSWFQLEIQVRCVLEIVSIVTRTLCNISEIILFLVLQQVGSLRHTQVISPILFSVFSLLHGNFINSWKPVEKTDVLVYSSASVSNLIIQCYSAWKVSTTYRRLSLPNFGLWLIVYRLDHISRCTSLPMSILHSISSQYIHFVYCRYSIICRQRSAVFRAASALRQLWTVDFVLFLFLFPNLDIGSLKIYCGCVLFFSLSLT